ncbi:unnamed protein product [Nezara viridula]|uniref:Uncharacterized protein n=1 Tax=Nezara viridula TaxID=85310 RepID=A0A9P0MPM2_NEZVI|nr:unnamed protein product [Nezara viridula]
MNHRLGFRSNVAALSKAEATSALIGGRLIGPAAVTVAGVPHYTWNNDGLLYICMFVIPGDDAKAIVLSSCPCDRDLHYVITTEGHVTYWNEQRIPPVDLPPEENINGIPLCRFNFS